MKRKHDSYVCIQIVPDNPMLCNIRTVEFPIVYPPLFHITHFVGGDLVKGEVDANLSGSS